MDFFSHLLLFDNKKVLIFFGVFTPRITLDAQIGLWTLSPLSSAVLTHPEPTIPFFHWSAVSHPKTRDFRFHEPTIPFFHWSAVSHPTSGHDVTRPIRSQENTYVSPLYYF